MWGRPGNGRTRAAACALPVDARGSTLAPASCQTADLAGADELFRTIYTRVGADYWVWLKKETPNLVGETLAISSAIAGEGKTTIALGLAVTLAQDYPEHRIVLVETDFQRPVLAEDLGVEPAPGLLEALLDDLPVERALRATALPNLHLLPAGHRWPLAHGVLRWRRMATIMATLRERHDLVILDLPPILVNSDTLALTDLAEGVLLVVRAGVTPGALVHKAIGQLDDSREKLRGVVLNEVHTAVPGWARRLCGLWGNGYP